MDDVTLTHLDDMQTYDGPYTIPGITLRRAAATLGVTAWGMNVLQLAPGCDGHPEHAHEQDRQEEVYAVLAGSASLVVGDQTLEMPTGTFVRVGPSVTRKLLAGPQGATILAIGAIPGETYRSQYAM